MRLGTQTKPVLYQLGLFPAEKLLKRVASFNLYIGLVKTIGGKVGLRLISLLHGADIRQKATTRVSQY